MGLERDVWPSSVNLYDDHKEGRWRFEYIVTVNRVSQTLNLHVISIAIVDSKNIHLL